MKKRSSDKKHLAVIRQKTFGKNCRSFCPTLYAIIAPGALLLVFAIYLTSGSAPKIFAENTQSDFEKAVYTKQEFFGQQAFVPFPTRTVQENLTALLAARPDDPQILEKLAEANEKLEKFAQAEANLKRLAEKDVSNNELLVAFYDRRGEYQKEAETLKKMFDVSKLNERASLFERLINLARLHDLRDYLNMSFYTQIVGGNSDAYPIFEKLIEKLFEEKDYESALEFVRTAKAQFPERRNFLLDKEIEILLVTNRKDEAEKVYQTAFDPFWSEEDAQKFYDFLNDLDKLRVYGGELQARFEKNPADFDAAIRLALYRDHDYSYGNEEITPIILKIEEAKKEWTLSELVTVTRLLLIKNEGATASRFLYTLFLRREDFQNNPELRAKVIYQLFEMFSDAESEKLPISKGDLRFYRDVARSDTDPGITTGILSLIFSDSSPGQKLDEKERIADRHFNRAAAYRIFEEYKKDLGASSTTPELAQMHLDLVRLYTADGETEFAGKLLDEFAERFGNSPEYSLTALKLAAAFTHAGREEKVRETYQKILDYLGKQPGSLSPRTNVQETTGDFSDDSQTTIEKSFIDASNDGINIPKLAVEPHNNLDASIERTGNFHDYLTRRNSAVTYAQVLEKLVASLAAEKKTVEILAVYSNEIQKHPAEEWLYEKRLEWLEQTNLTAEKLEFYKTALARFQSNNWQDKLARFFVREKRREEFVALSEDLIGKLKDREIENYLAEFAGTYFSPIDWDGKLSVQLYRSAHKRFPHNINFVEGLLRIYKTNRQENEWRSLAAEYYFESAQIRKVFLDALAEKNELRNYLQNAQGKEEIIYNLFRADASARLSDFENAVAAYRTLDALYPHTTEFSERLISFTRSFGQRDQKFLNEAFAVSKAAADFQNSSALYRTRSGEISAEMGDYQTARGEWEKLIQQGAGSRQNYLDAATVYWDYFQYEDALRTIENARTKFSAPMLYAFETGAILEAEHKDDEAIRKYVKALDSDGGDREEQKEKAKKYLAKLVLTPSKQSDQPIDAGLADRRIEKAFESEKAKRKDPAFFSLAYAEFLVKIRKHERAGEILNSAVSQNDNEEFLSKARDFYQSNEMTNGEQNVLRKLAATSVTTRRKIQYSLQLAQNFEQNKKREAAKKVILSLHENFPANYGVVTETSEIYRRLGFDTEAVKVLADALPKSRGFYRAAIARKLSKQLIRLNKPDEAEKILAPLYEESPSDLDIFNQLAEIYVRRRDSASLKKIFGSALKSLKESDGEKREIDGQIAEFRRRMINAFTQLKDYKSATEQFIEIINRDPDDEETIEQAIRYVKRYGAAETLLNYYKKTVAESFKNYRWNVVLARIYLANNDIENALKNYQTAIVNQPEMSELYLAVVEIETKRNNYDAALENLNEVLEISGNAPEYVKKKIEILKKAGRFGEIEAEKAKLPVEDKKKIKTNEFTDAQNMANTEREKSLEVFRQAFENLLENPLSGEPKTADLAAYVQAARTKESLAEINKRMWNLRGKLTAIADADDSINAGEARKRLEILDSAIIEAVGAIAKTMATDEELSVLHADLNKEIENAQAHSDGDQILSLLQNLSRRAGFGDLEEKILLKKLETAVSETDEHSRLQNLLDFYKERGAYQKSFDLAQKYAGDNFPLLAETAQLAGNRQKETEALRAIYHRSSLDSQSENAAPAAANSENVQRYLEILYRENRSELESLTGESSVYQLQLINFLLGKGEKILAHQAIENSDFSDAWKVSRGAEVSLALREFDQAAECYFCEALQLAPIGEMIAAPPDKTSFLINDDWFRLTREYGEWLKYKSVPDAHSYLAAMTENQPKNADEQLKLGEFYLEQKEYRKAISHLNLAIETENLAVPDKRRAAVLGAALYLSGEKTKAEKLWSQIFENLNEDEEIPVALLYLQALQKHGLAEEGRKPLPPLIVKFLARSDADRSEEFQNLIRLVASSFTDEAAKAEFFMQVLEKRSTDRSLAVMLIKENLVAASNVDFFYQRLIERNSFNNYFYDFAGVRERVWSRDDAEIIYDQENNYESDESDEENIDGWDGKAWRKKYLRLLVERGENLRAEEFAEKLEKETGENSPRPAWLRLEKMRLQIRFGKFELTTAEKFIGIRLPESATEIKPPNVERYNEVLKIFKEESRADLTAPISEAFYARNLALGELGAANFTNLARIAFERGETAQALNILRLLIEANDSALSESALSEIALLEAVKNNSEAEIVKISVDGTRQSIDLASALGSAAETAFEFGQKETAINFRRRLAEISPENSANKIALAKLLLVDPASKLEGIKILHEIADDRNTLRVNRWQARQILSERGEFLFSDAAEYDALAQFYRGLTAAQAKQNDQAIVFFVQSLIDDKDVEVNARQELIKAYASAGIPSAVVRFAESEKGEKSDELLQVISAAAEQTGEFQKAIQYERSKSSGGDGERIMLLEKLLAEKNKRVTDFVIDAENTRKL